MAIDLEQIKKNYASFDNYKIEHLAKNEAGSLDPAVIPILMDEIKKRDLDPNLVIGIEAQTKNITETELSELKSKIVCLPCPICGQRNSSLIGVLIREVKSYVLITSYKKTTLIACPCCAEKKKKDAIIITLLMGWWGIPAGLIHTPHAIINSILDRKKKEIHSDAIITHFAVENRGEIRTNWDKENELSEYIAHKNSLN